MNLRPNEVKFQLTLDGSRGTWTNLSGRGHDPLDCPDVRAKIKIEENKIMIASRG